MLEPQRARLGFQQESSGFWFFPIRLDGLDQITCKGVLMSHKKLSAQSLKFVETAKQIGCSDDDAAFDGALKKIASAPPPKSVEKRKTKKPAK